ncbi:MAG: serine/threonine-protein kinase [Phycisphaerae bacterium]|nr:serine/threonine-protein kinase [Phycisphaerae bacterium]
MHSHDRTSIDADAAARMELAIDEVLRHEESGAPLDDAEVGRRYPGLLPDLLDQLRIARAIRTARAAARQPSKPPSLMVQDSEGSRGDPLAFLGDALCHYRVLRKIDYGGQGVVYEAVDERTGGLVAIKIMRDGPFATPRQRERFAREIKLIARLHHPNIVSLYHDGEANGCHYFVMEHVSGAAIDEFVAYKRLSVRDVVRLFVPVCRAVAEAHQRSIVHRDLKPANILVDLDGAPHILDFGLAKDIDDSSSDDVKLSMTGQMFGTLPYASPEQADGRPNDIDPRSDVYSLGVILYELLSGALPYRVDGSIDETRANIRTAVPERISRVRSRAAPERGGALGRVPDDLENVVLKALAKEKSRRYQSADALAEDLERFLAGHAVEAKRDSRWYQLRKSMQRHRVAVGFSLALFAVLVGALIGMTLLWRQSVRVAAVAQAALVIDAKGILANMAIDEGRLEHAIDELNLACQMADAISTDDRFFNTTTARAHRRLAFLYIDAKDCQRARPHIDSCARISEALYAAEPENTQFMRDLGLSLRLRGEYEKTQENFGAALRHFERFGAIVLQLRRRFPDNDALLSDYTNALGSQAWCLRELGQFDRAFARYETAYTLLRRRADADPKSVEKVTSLIVAENKLAVWHLSQKSFDHARRAEAYLDRAESRLKRLLASGRVTVRQKVLEETAQAIGKNREIAERQMSDYAAQGK